MRLKIMLVLSAILLLLMSAASSASMLIPANDNAKENSNAPQHSPVIGDDWDLERVDFVHYAQSTNPAKVARTDSCYKLMGVKWLSLPVSYSVNPFNAQGLSEEFVTSAVSVSADAWDAATSKELFNDYYSVDYYATYGVRNGVNAIVFGDYGQSNVIGVTSVWYTRVGKQIVEFDMLLNDQFQWGDASVDPSKMDLQNILTHELGHSVGLSDLYTGSCASVTMYGYSGEGDVQKRSLEQADVLGLQKMYGI
ncbi:MAG: matrixin family metalloprotease [Candidatus Woesearchaeota archaeon]